MHWVNRMKIALYTLGCKVNQYDTQAMSELLENAGHECVEFEEQADVYLINTCTVTGTGDKKSRQMISRAHALNPEAKIVVAGCYAQRAPQEVLALPGVDMVLGTKERASIVEKIASLDQAGTVNAVGDLREENKFEEMSVSREGRTRAHLKIQEGCDRFCSYCIIPYARGPIRSRPLADIRRQMELLSAAGYPEIVLTGIHLMSYGKEWKNGITLLDAIRQADGLLNIQRIRIGSLEPQLLTEDFVAYLANNKRVCRQFHLSLQSGSAAVLKRMRRRYTPEEYMQCLAALRGAMPDCAVTTDIIVGFPGETEQEFQETLDFAREAKFSRIHVFPYSRRQGTPAYSMPGQLSRGEKAARASRLIALGEELEKEHMRSYIGTKQNVLMEECQGGVWQGYTDTYLRVHAHGAPEGENLSGKIMAIQIDEIRDLQLHGNIITKAEV